MKSFIICVSYRQYFIHCKYRYVGDCIKLSTFSKMFDAGSSQTSFLWMWLGRAKLLDDVKDYNVSE